MGDNPKEIRWKQRLGSLNKAFDLLRSAVEQNELSRLEEEGLIQRFEYTFELSWKTLKDFQAAKGIDLAFPRDVIKEAFRAGLIADGEVWMDMLDSRNELSHTYSEERFALAIVAVRQRFYPAVSALVSWLRSVKDV